MGRFIPGKYRYTWNMGTGDVRIYDVFQDGRVREKKMDGSMKWISDEDAVEKLDDIIRIFEALAEKHKGSNQYYKVYCTKADIHRQIKAFIQRDFQRF